MNNIRIMTNTKDRKEFGDYSVRVEDFAKETKKVVKKIKRIKK
jgi:hypothetical protein